MTKEEKSRFLSDVYYFHFEKGDLERLNRFTPKKLREVSQKLYKAYIEMLDAQCAFDSMLESELEELENQENA